MSTDDERTPPQNNDAEMALLGALLNNPGAAEQLALEVDGSDFYRPAHEQIWNAAQALAVDPDTPLDPITLAERLRADGELQRVGGAPYLHTLMQACPAPGNAAHYAELVRNAARLRQVQDVATRLLQVVKDGQTDDLESVFTRAYERLDAAAGRLGPNDTPPRASGSQRLSFYSVADLRQRAAARGPRQWLIRGLWPAGTYGVHAASEKAQKTWNAFDLAVSVASGTPWLGHFPIDAPGGVLIFAGEGGEGEVLRRLDGIATSRSVSLDDLDIVVCDRAPHLSDTQHMDEMRRQLARHRPRLVVLDPLYLSAKGADLKDLYGMGALLETAQHACADIDAALWVNHHHNRSRDARGSRRMSGAGPAEWGRILIDAAVISRHTDSDTKETRVLTELDATGGSIADDKFRIFRKIRAEDPDDLESPLHYSVEVLAVDDTTPAGTTSTDTDTDLTPAQSKLLEALRNLAEPATTKQLVDWISDKYGHGLTRETTSKSLNRLAELGHADSLEQDQNGGRWPRKLWFIPTQENTDDDPANTPCEPRDITRELHTA